MLSTHNRIKKFGSRSTIFLIVSESRRGLKRTLSHTSTRVGTGAKIAVRKLRGGRIRGMKVLACAHNVMNTARWDNMDRADREQAAQCPCEGAAVYRT